MIQVEPLKPLNTRQSLYPEISWHINAKVERQSGSYLIHWLVIHRIRDSNEPLYNVMYEIRFNVRDTPAHLREAERWKVPNKLTDRSRG